MDETQTRHPDDETVKAGVAAVVEMLEAGRVSDAVEATNQLLRDHPDHADPYHMLGFLLCRAGRLAPGVRMLERSVELDGSLPGAHYNLAMAYRAMGREAEALAAFLQAVELRDDHADAMAAAARIQERRREFAEARALYERAVEAAPEHVDALAGLAGIRAAEGVAAEAREMAAKGLALAPGHAGLNLVMARLLRDAGDPDGALARLDAVDDATADPMSARAVDMLRKEIDASRAG